MCLRLLAVRQPLGNLGGHAVLLSYSCALHWWMGSPWGVVCAFLTLSLPLNCGL